ALGRDKQSALTHREGRGGSVTASLAAFRAGDRCRTGFEPRQEDHVARDPLAILAPVRDLPLHLVVLENLLMGEVHEEDLARTESSLLHDAFGFDIEYPDLRAHHHEAVRGDGVASRAQAVAVEGGA